MGPGRPDMALCFLQIQYLMIDQLMFLILEIYIGTLPILTIL